MTIGFNPFFPAALHVAGPSYNPTLCSIHDELSQEAGGGSAMVPGGLEPLGRLLETTPPVADEPIETFLVKYSRKIFVTSGAVSGLGFLYFYLAGVPENRTFHFLSPFQQVVLGTATLSGMIFASLIRRAGQDFIMVDDPSGGRSEQRHGVATNAELLGKELSEAEALARAIEATHVSHGLSEDLEASLEWRDKCDALRTVLKRIADPAFRDPRLGERPHSWHYHRRVLNGGHDIAEYKQADDVLRKAIATYPSLVAFSAQPGLKDQQPFSLSFPRFLARPVPGVRQWTFQTKDGGPVRSFSGSLKVAGWNVNLWGHLSATPKTTKGITDLVEAVGESGETMPNRFLEQDWPLYGTCFNWRDADRARDIGEYLRDLPEEESPDVVCLQEVFDHTLAEETLWPILREKYPYAVLGASARGIPGILFELGRRYPTLIGALTRFNIPIQEVIDSLLGGYYVPNAASAWQRFKQGANEFLFPTRRVMGLLSKMFEDPAFWGSGNVIFSRYPVASFGYASHPARTDFEIFTDKGVLWADLVLGPNRRVRVLNSHMNDGGRDYNEEVRRRQALQISRLMNEAGTPAVLLADMNAVAGSPSYETLASAASGIRDGFLEAYPELAAGGSVVSFLPNNPFARLKGAKDAAHEKPGRIDHILLSGGFRAKPGQVTYEDRWKRPLEKGGTFWRTDHALLRAELILEPISHPLPPVNRPYSCS